LHAVQPLEWLAVPLSLFYANLSEYLGHRFPMHRPLPGLALVYKRHSGQHHRFFSDQAMRSTASATCARCCSRRCW
jgi:hypothetical protein